MNIEKEIVIREFAHDDKEMVITFFKQMSGETNLLFNPGDCNLKRAMAYFEVEDKKTINFLAEYNNEMVGYVFLWENNMQIPWLGIAVSENMKGRSFGKKLMGFIEGYAKEHKKGGILLTTHVANLRAQALYEHMGYEKLGVHNSGQFLYLRRFSE